MINVFALRTKSIDGFTFVSIYEFSYLRAFVALVIFCFYAVKSVVGLVNVTESVLRSAVGK